MTKGFTHKFFDPQNPKSRFGSPARLYPMVSKGARGNWRLERRASQIGTFAPVLLEGVGFQLPPLRYELSGVV